MKNLLITLLLTFCVNHFVCAQQGIAEIGRITTGFLYTNSDGEEMDILFPVHSFSYSAGYRRQVGNIFFANGSLVFNRYGQEGSDTKYQNIYEWDAYYLGLNLAMDIEFFQKSRFSLMALAAAEPQILLGGTQRVNSEIRKLNGVEQFDNPFLFLKGGLGINYCLDNRIAVTGRYRYGVGLPLGKSEDGENLKLTSSTISIGLMVSFGYYNYCQKKHFD